MLSLFSALDVCLNLKHIYIYVYITHINNINILLIGCVCKVGGKLLTTDSNQPDDDNSCPRYMYIVADNC